MKLAFSYLVAVHNEEGGLPALVERLTERLSDFPGSEIVLCENGSSDGSLALAERFARESTRVPVRALSTPNAGLGHGLAMGMSAVLEASAGEDLERWIVLTAADLPFDFSDLEQVLAWRASSDGDAILIGSKAHPRTVRQRDWKRAVATSAFRGLRTAILGMRTGDPQGTFFLPRRRAAEILPLCRARNYFFTTEIVFWAEQRGIPVVEVPVVFAEERRKSTVRILKHGREMALQTLELRLRASGL